MEKKILSTGNLLTHHFLLKNCTESANDMVLKASEAKKQGDLLSALDHHTQAAKLYKDIAVLIRDINRESENIEYFCIH